MGMIAAQVRAAILDTVAARLATVNLGDPALTSLTFTVHLREGGGWPRAVTMRAEVKDDLPTPRNGDDPSRWDACGPPRRHS